MAIYTNFFTLSIFSLLVGKGLKKINKYGITDFYISYYNLPKQVTQYHNFFLIDNNIFFYNDHNKVEYINPDGTRENTEKAKDKLNEISNREKIIQENTDNSIILPDNLNQIFIDLQENPDYLIVNDKFYSSLRYQTMEYFEKIKVVREYVIAEKERLYGYKNKVDINLDNYSLHFIDYDDDHNGYWEGIRDDSDDLKSYAVIIFSKYGELLDVFLYGQYKTCEEGYLEPYFKNYPASGAEIAIAPNGDVYFMVGNEKEYTFYKVKRAW